MEKYNMDRILPHFLLLIFLTFAIVSCRTSPPPPILPRTEYEPLTLARLREIDKQIQKNKNGTYDITDIQFYLSSDLTLISDESHINISIVQDPNPNRPNQKRGDVFQTKQRTIEKIVFKPESAGTIAKKREADGKIQGIKKMGKDRWMLGISFESGDDNDNNLLWFTQSQNNDFGFFYLQLVDYDTLSGVLDDSINYESLLRIKYGDKHYFASLSSDEIPHLMIRVDNVNKTEVDQTIRIVQGNLK
jgi:hypothetical protein